MPEDKELINQTAILLNELVKEIREARKPPVDPLISDLSRKMTDIQTQVGDHGVSITLMSSTMENVNKILETSSMTFKQIQQDLSHYIRNQDRMIEQNTSILRQLEGHEEKLKVIDNRETEKGCPVLNHHLQERQITLETFKEKEKSLTKAHEQNTEDIEALNEKVTSIQKELEIIKPMIEKISKTIDNIQEKPRKRMEVVIEKGIGWAVVTILAIIGAKIGLKV